MAATYFHEYQPDAISGGDYLLTYLRHGVLVHAEAKMGARGCYRLTIWEGEATRPTCEWDGDLGADDVFACPDNFAERVEREISEARAAIAAQGGGK